MNNIFTACLENRRLNPREAQRAEVDMSAGFREGNRSYGRMYASMYPTLARKEIQGCTS